MHAHKPLCTEQLLSAIQLRLANEHDDPVLDTRGRRLSEQKLESICRYLIVKDARGKWAFPHASVQEYFVEKHTELTNKDARIEVAKLSLLVLMEYYQSSTPTESSGSGQLSNETAGDDSSIVCKPDSVDSLKHYLSQYWVLHIRDVQGVPDGNKQISKLLERFMISLDNPCHSTLEYQKWLEYIGLLGNNYSFNLDVCQGRDLMPAENPAFGIVVLGITLDEKEWAKTCLERKLEELHKYGLDTLSLAAQYGRAELCVSLIKMGSDPKRILPSRTGALDQAIMKKETTSVKELLMHGADPNVDTKRCPLCQAVFFGGREIFELLIKHGALLDGPCSSCVFSCPLEAAAYLNNEDAADILINAGATVDLRLDGEFSTPLVTAAYYGSFKVAKLLIKYRADVKIKQEPIDSNTIGGVLGAAFCSHQAIKLVSYLIEEAEADPNRIIEDLMGRNPWVSNPLESRGKISEWLFRNKHLNPDEVQGLEIGDCRALKPLVRTAKRFARERSSGSSSLQESEIRALKGANRNSGR
ncbi:uncharacterized protein TrAtP1_009244 [Trichoderma atroviride]|uniref:uncharacterized protein n=1 Tax=Hypocrea atroviridis TaxID=63577 RepID=UPI00332FE405|nr:hypothetical protein TrAtP1_009244 [Trichoderma atroviride]